jgi:hypothetical protein
MTKKIIVFAIVIVAFGVMLFAGSNKALAYKHSHQCRIVGNIFDPGPGEGQGHVVCTDVYAY